MKAVVIAGGSISDYEYARSFIDSGDIIICCDGGLRHCEGLGVSPQLIVGDFDSVPPELLYDYEGRGTAIVRVPAEKDFTDGELGLMKAIEAGASYITILGGTGTRLDHSLTNCHLLIKALKKGVRARLIDEHNTVYVTDSHLSLKLEKRETVSLIPLTTEVKEIYTKGLYYKLEGGSLRIGESLGVSNLSISPEVDISIGEGILMIITAKD